MLVPQRHANTSDYRYGFNGKELDNEIKGEGLQIDYGFRIYDPRIGKFLSMDPLTSSFPWFTPYQFAGNKPIVAVDLDGLEELDYRILENLNYGDIKVDMSNAPDVFEKNGKKYYTTLNALGEKRNPQYYFTKALEQAPEWWSADNVKRINGGEMPQPDETFLKKLGKNLDAKDFAKLKEASMIPKTRRRLLGMEHHHLNHGDQAIALPWKVHRGKGNSKFWHKFGKKLKAGKNFTKKVPIIGAIISIVDAGAHDVGPAENLIGVSGFDVDAENIEIFLSMVDIDGLESAVEAFSDDDKFSIYYATLQETKNLLETGQLPDGDSYYGFLQTAQELDYYDEIKSPYMLFFYGDELIKIEETPQDPENDPARQN